MLPSPTQTARVLALLGAFAPLLWSPADAKGIVSLVSVSTGNQNPEYCRSMANPICYVGIGAEGKLLAVGNDHNAEYGLTTAGVDIFDISDPKNPVLLMNWQPTDDNCGINVSDNHCRTDIDELEYETDRLMNMRFSEGVEILNGYGFFGAAYGTANGISGGTYIVDLRDPEGADFGRVVYHIVDPNDEAMQVHNLNVANIGSETFLYLTGLNRMPYGYATEEIQIYNVTDPSSTYLQNTIYAPWYPYEGNGWVHDIKIVRRTSGSSVERVYLFASVMGYHGGLDGYGVGYGDRVVVYDITNGATGYNNPYDVYIVGEIDVADRTHSLSVSPDGAYMFENDEPTSAVAPYDPYWHTFCNTEINSTPPTPRYDLPGTPGVLCAWEPGTSTQRIYSLSWNYDGDEVTGSRISSTLDDPTNFGIDANKVAHHSNTLGNYLAVAWYRDGLKLFNAANPAIPLLVGSYDTYNDATEFLTDFANFNDVAIFMGGLEVFFLPNNQIALTDAKYGLFIFSTAAWTPPTIMAPMLLQ